MVRVIADLHIHSKYSRATSMRMEVGEIARFSEIKGLNLVGTGDFTHPAWFKELRRELVEVEDGSGIYAPARMPTSRVRFMVTGEISTVFEWEGKTRKIHHLLLIPDMEVAEQVSEALSRFGDLSVDGRPTLNAPAPEVVEAVMEVSLDIAVIPAHVWTPWFSLFGAFSGFDRVEDCYQDMTKHIFALETGLSSDPPMNWRLSSLDRYALVSNSDSHSPWPWRIGREANVFELSRLTYREVVDAVRSRDGRFRMTIEVNPAYGKYHWTGHRKCGVSMPPSEAMKLGNVCPVCRRPLTKGVEQRVEELADRPMGFRPEGAVDYVHLLPLSEIISSVTGSRTLASGRVWEIYMRLVKEFGDEFTVLLDAPKEGIAKVAGERIAEAVLRVREGRVRVVPGYDGVYGRILIFEEPVPERSGQRTLSEFF